MRIQKRVLLIIFMATPFVAICQEKKGWRPIDRASLIGYLANPGFELGTAHNDKELVYSFYFDRDLYGDNSKLYKRGVKVFSLTYRYALKSNLHLYDTLHLNIFTLDGLQSKSMTSSLSKNARTARVTTLKRFGEVGGILFFPCVTMDGYYGKEKALIYQLDKANCPPAKKAVDLDAYTLSLAWITKDYVVREHSPYKCVCIYYTGPNGETLAQVYFRFDDKEVFGKMYDHPLFKWRNNL